MSEVQPLHTVILICSGLLLFLLISILIKLKRDDYRRFGNTDKQPAETPGPHRRCPLCGHPLLKGQTVHSVLYPGKPDGLMEIYGCPFCKTEGGAERLCPVCGKKLDNGEFLIARVFKKPEKTHVHVLGCTSCYRGPSRTSGKPANG